MPKRPLSEARLVDQLIKTASGFPPGSRNRTLVLDVLQRYRVAVAKKYDHIDFKPPEAVAKAAEKGLEYREKQGKDKAGLTPEEASEEGIGSGVQRATNLKNRDTISPEVVRQMVGFFSRHEKNKSIAPEHKDEPWKDKGYVSWLLWGGDPGKTWAEKVSKQMEAADKKAKEASFKTARPDKAKMKTADQVRDHIIRAAHKSDPKTRARLLPLARKLVALTQPKQAEGWSKLPKGWTQESVKKFWDKLTGERKHKVTACIKKMEGKMDDPGAFCASLADMMDPGWRSERSGSLPAGAKIAGMHVDREQVRFYFDTRHVVSIRTASVINDLSSLPTDGDTVAHVEPPDSGGHVGITFGSGKSLTVHTDYHEGPQSHPTKLATDFYAFLGELAEDVSDEESDDILSSLLFGFSDIEPTLRSDWPEIPNGNRAASEELAVGDHVELVDQQNTIGGVVPTGTTGVVTGLNGGPNNDKVLIKLDEGIESQPLTKAVPVEPLNLKRIACECGCNCGGACSCATDKVMQFAAEHPDLASAVMPAVR